MVLKINQSLLPLKVYFGFYLAGLACIIPHIFVFARQLGFNNGEVGVISGILPFVGLLSKPIVGVIADKLDAHRIVLLVALVVQGVFTFAVYYLPPSPAEPHIPLPARLNCNQDAAFLEFQANYSSVFCTDSPNSTSVDCHLSNPVYVDEALNISHMTNPAQFTLHRSGNISNGEFALQIPVLIQYHESTRSTCQKSLDLNCSAYFCKESPISTEWVRFSQQFWLFLIIMIISRIGYTAVYTMGDSVAFDMISQQKQAVSYGRQRVFGSVGWAIAAVIVGLLMDQFSDKQGTETGYAPAFYGFITLLACALVTAWFLKPSQNIQSTQLLKNVLKLFDDGEFIAFSTGTFLVGVLTGLLYAFLFIYMKEDLGAANLLMGLTQLAECFGEVPFMFLSNWLIMRMGHHGAMTFALASFSVRYIGYSLVQRSQPWWMLVLELLHGPGFGLFYANMATFAHNVAPPGAVATMQGVLGGIYDGFGMALGGLIGGSIFSRYGGRVAWRAFGISAGIAAIGYSIVTVIFHRRKRQLLNVSDKGATDSVQNNGYETPIPPDTPSEKERLTRVD